MVAMARAGGGQQYYGQRAEDLYDAFDEELSLLQAMMLRQLRVKPVPAPGLVVEALGRGRPAVDGWLTLPDLAWGGEAWILLRLHVSAEPGAAKAGKAAGRGTAKQPAQRTLIALSWQGTDLAGDAVVQHAAALVLPVLPAAAVAALPADEAVARRLQEFEFAELNLQVREMLQQGRRAQAKAALTRAKARVADHQWLAGKLERLSELVAQDVDMAQKEMLYSSGKIRFRLAQKSEVPSVTDETASLEVPAFLRRKASKAPAAASCDDGPGTPGGQKCAAASSGGVTLRCGHAPRLNQRNQMMNERMPVTDLPTKYEPTGIEPVYLHLSVTDPESVAAVGRQLERLRLGSGDAQA